MRRFFVTMLIIVVATSCCAALAEGSDMLISRETFLEKAGISVDAAANADIEGFIEEYQINNYLFDVMSEPVVRQYAEHLIENAPLNYEYLFENETIPLPMDVDYSTLKRLVLVNPDDAAIASLLVNFDLGRVYFHPTAYIIDDVCLSSRIIALDDAYRADIINALQGVGLDKWQTTYSGSTEGERGEPWVLALEFDDGIVRYSVVGSNNGAPYDAILALDRALMGRFWFE